LKEPTFWEKAYEEIVNDEDKKNRMILQAYDILLERAAEQQDKDSEDVGDDIATAEVSSVPENADQADLNDITPPVKRRVGNEEVMRNIARAKLSQMQEKEWTIKWKGDVFKIRDQVTRIVKVLQTVSGLVGTATALDTTHAAGLAWAGVCVLLPV
jgi:hypothetical protein